MSNFNRRHFIKTSSAIAAASALPFPMLNIRTAGASLLATTAGLISVACADLTFVKSMTRALRLFLRWHFGRSRASIAVPSRVM